MKPVAAVAGTGFTVASLADLVKRPQAVTQIGAAPWGRDLKGPLNGLCLMMRFVVQR